MARGGRPRSVQIDEELVRRMRAANINWNKIAKVLGVNREALLYRCSPEHRQAILDRAMRKRTEIPSPPPRVEPPKRVQPRKTNRPAQIITFNAKAAAERRARLARMAAQAKPDPQFRVDHTVRAPENESYGSRTDFRRAPAPYAHMATPARYKQED